MRMVGNQWRTNRFLTGYQPGTADRAMRVRRVRVVALLLAASTAAVALTGCANPVSLQRADIAAARTSVQAETADRVDLTGLVVLGQLHDADCTVGSNMDPGRDAYEFFCYSREIRVVDLGRVDPAEALAAADRATSAVCGQTVASLSDPANSVAPVGHPVLREAQVQCGDMTLDVLVGQPDDEDLMSNVSFWPRHPTATDAKRTVPGLDAASRAGSSYVLCLLGRMEFIRQMR
ncbi:hypothetical protein [Pengzhenrongella phosphoraccumulans]|uniref:hypothetical protein n=1 Tax=Pengzhenrongella phosphoraccumulans TaxID=3114394 RepID=UPI00388E7FDB